MSGFCFKSVNLQNVCVCAECGGRMTDTQREAQTQTSHTLLGPATIHPRKQRKISGDSSPQHQGRQASAGLWLDADLQPAVTAWTAVTRPPCPWALTFSWKYMKNETVPSCTEELSGVWKPPALLFCQINASQRHCPWGPAEASTTGSHCPVAPPKKTSVFYKRQASMGDAVE